AWRYSSGVPTAASRSEMRLLAAATARCDCRAPAEMLPCRATATNNASVTRSTRARFMSDRATIEHGAGDRPGIDVLEFTACRDTACQARHFHAARLEHFADIVRCGLAFVGEVGGENHLAHTA